MRTFLPQVVETALGSDGQVGLLLSAPGMETIAVGLGTPAEARLVGLAILAHVAQVTAPDDARELMPPAPTPRDVFGGGRR